MVLHPVLFLQHTDRVGTKATCCRKAKPFRRHLKPAMGQGKAYASGLHPLSTQGCSSLGTLWETLMQSASLISIPIYTVILCYNRQHIISLSGYGRNQILPKDKVPESSKHAGHEYSDHFSTDLSFQGQFFNSFLIRTFLGHVLEPLLFPPKLQIY